uniref:NADH-ubiquinone oxidoreductase chain 2 n=1 Tax=Cheironitis hoplosternus TaxID=206730 RepID=A0A1X9HDJ9_9SCAR|nr:NADH deshydrogenase subunit 2 [Cheironitis hoplosternus]
MQFNKLLFTFTMMTGTLISISSYSWMGMWLGLEINLLSIIPLMSSTNNSLASEAAMKYFITQAMASTMLLFSIIIMSLNMAYLINNLYLILILNTSLFMKMGAAPFHFWFPEIIEGLNWNNTLIMLTWQKIAPMILISYCNMNLNYLILIIISSTIISGIMGINQVSMRKILAYSSINHISWMMCSMLYFENLWMLYFIIYSIITFNIIIILKKFNVYFMSQLFSIMNNQPLIKFFFMLNFFSLGGLPPFLGFMPKWLTIQVLIENNLMMISIIVIVITLITLFFYIRITLMSLVLYNKKLLFYKSYSMNMNMNYIYILNFITLTSLIVITILFNLN